MKEFLKRLIRFISVIVIIALIPLLVLVESIKWAFDFDEPFEMFDGIFMEIFHVLTFQLFDGDES